jgi:K+-transporting ATPase ATPase A chain
MMPMLNMMLGESPWRRRGGSVRMLIIAVIAVFIAGLLVGRTPEYLGKKIGPREIKLASLYILVMPTLSREVSPSASRSPPSERTWKRPRYGTPAHGLSELVRVHVRVEQQWVGVRRTHREHAVAERRAGRGDAAGPVRAHRPRSRPGRFLWPHRTRYRPPPARPTHRPLFIGLVVGTAVLVTALVFFPVLTLGPLAEGL